MSRALNAKGWSWVGVAAAALLTITGTIFLAAPIAPGSEFRARGELVGSILSVAALIVAGFALFLNVRVEESSFVAEENAKRDIAALLATVRMLYLKLSLAGPLRLAQDPALLIREERARLAEILHSTSGFALILLSAHKQQASNRESVESDHNARWELAQLYLVSLVSDGDQPIDFLTDNAVKVEELLASLDADDIRRLGWFVRDLSDASGEFSQSRETDFLPSAQEAGRKRQEEARKVNSAADLEKLQALRDSGVDDPNVDLWIAMLDDEMEESERVERVRGAVERGADVNQTLGVTLRQATPDR